jgi:hypothetical protein
MRKIIATGAVVLFTLLLLGSCSKSSSENFTQNTSITPDRVITAKVSPGQTQMVTVDNDGEISIVRQALHFKISATGIDPKNNALVYNYAPVDGFTGSDEVLLAHKTLTGYSGSCNYGDGQNMTSSRTVYVAIKITVAQ